MNTCIITDECYTVNDVNEIYRIAYQKLMYVAAAEDVVQDVFMSVVTISQKMF